jgi:hypothetical protein
MYRTVSLFATLGFRPDVASIPSLLSRYGGHLARSHDAIRIVTDARRIAVSPQFTRNLVTPALVSLPVDVRLSEDGFIPMKFFDATGHDILTDAYIFLFKRYREKPRFHNVGNAACRIHLGRDTSADRLKLFLQFLEPPEKIVADYVAPYQGSGSSRTDRVDADSFVLDYASNVTRRSFPIPDAEEARLRVLVSQGRAVLYESSSVPPPHPSDPDRSFVEAGSSRWIAEVTFLSFLFFSPLPYYLLFRTDVDLFLLGSPHELPCCASGRSCRAGADVCSSNSVSLGFPACPCSQF